MIYEYPEEFIVPIIYDKDLIDRAMYRCKEQEFLHLGKLSMPDEELQTEEMLLAEVDVYGMFKNKDISVLDKEEEILEGFFKQPIIMEGIVEESVFGDEDIRSILSDIDEDYANSETLRR